MCVGLVKQGWLVLVEYGDGLQRSLAGRPERAHHLQQSTVLPVDLEQRVTPAASAPDGTLAVGRIVLGMAAAPALPPEGPDFEHSLTVYHFPRMLCPI